MKKNLIIYIVAAVLIVAVLIFIGISANKRKKGTGAEKTINEAINEAVTNPGDKIPSTNPYEKVVNPFRDAYKNPFSK